MTVRLIFLIVSVVDVANIIIVGVAGVAGVTGVAGVVGAMAVRAVASYVVMRSMVAACIIVVRAGIKGVVSNVVTFGVSLVASKTVVI